MSNIRYEKLLLRQGSREDLPLLDSGELGFANDTAQVFIGTDPDKAIHIANNVVKIDAFPNAKAVVQSYLNSSLDYSTYTVNEDLTIEVEDNTKALEVISYINTTNAQNFGSSAVPIATLVQNVELVTSQNVHDYAHPSDFNANYNPISGFERPSRTLLSKELDSTLGGVFLEYDIKQLFQLTINYVLVQRDGWHRRSGQIRVVSDNNASATGNIGFVDNQSLFTSALHDDFVDFDAVVINGKVRISFTQPSSDVTKIFYRVDRWNIDGVVDGAFNSMSSAEPTTVLGVDGGALDANGNYIQVDDN